MDEAKQLDSRIKHIEDRLMQYDRELGPRFQSLESQLQLSSTQQISTSLSKVLQGDHDVELDGWQKRMQDEITKKIEQDKETENVMW